MQSNAPSMDTCSSLHRRLHSEAFVRSPLQSRQQTTDFARLTQSFQCSIIENRECWNKILPRQVFSLAARSRFVPMRERENMRQNCIQSKNAKSLLLLSGIRMARLLPLSAVAFGLAASLSPKPVHAQEYPWCVSRESYLYCFYKTQEQCQWTASGIGGCALNPRLLFPNKSRDSGQDLLSHLK